jgi:hypothetical protein
MFSLVDMISEIRQYKTSLLDVEVFAFIQRGEIQVQNALRGISSDKLSHLLQAETTKTIRSDSPTMVLPDDAGRILRVEVDGKSIPVLDLDNAGATVSNHLYEKSAVRVGSELRFYGLPVSKAAKSSGLAEKNAGLAARIVYEANFEPALFLEGFYAKFSEYPYSDSGVSLTVLDIMYPMGQQFKDGSLKGATLRLYDNEHQARDWTIFTNFFGTPGDFVAVVKDTQRIVLNNDPNAVNVNFPTFSKYGEFSFPIRITRIALPAPIREAIVLWAKYELTDNPRFRQDYFNYLAQFGVPN